MKGSVSQSLLSFQVFGQTTEGVIRCLRIVYNRTGVYFDILLKSGPKFDDTLVGSVCLWRYPYATLDCN
jgi:hypothetical protein